MAAAAAVASLSAALGLRVTARAGATAGAFATSRSGFLKRVVSASPRCAGGAAITARGLAETTTGAILPKPEKISLGLTKVFTVVIPFLILGAIASKKGAELLEEHDIFVPDDDDDDD
ncbi:essential MCU regulator, mitochondrial [Lampetra planeri]